MENGFAHANVARLGILYAEYDAYAAWHCGQTDGNRNYYSIEVCQSMADLEIFRRQIKRSLKLARTETV
ncbi:MAG: N-acetylmuramoyl-L-alanine amidase [[Ruminococcus] torques]